MPHLIQIQECSGAPLLPAMPEPYHVVRGDVHVLFVPDGSRLYELPAGTIASDLEGLVRTLGAEPAAPPLRFEEQASALSLNIAQACNLACAYCYADEGRFGGDPQLMPQELAELAISRHLDRTGPTGVSIGFIGGEPLLNRPVLHHSVAYAANLAARRRVPVTFGITTNGALLSSADIELLRSYPFAVTISLDGVRGAHDAVRKTRSGAPSFDAILERVAPLLSNPGRAKIAARVTLTRRFLDVAACVDELAAAGFGEIGFSPLRTSPDSSLCLQDSDWQVLLAAMQHAAARDWARVEGTRDALRFSNFATALKQLYRGASEVLPCRAAAGYVSLSAKGRYYTCHRTVNDDACDLGDAASGPSPEARLRFVSERHVDSQEPCRTCWARYLCGGGCHAEVLQAGRSGCDFIRGWLEHCIAVYPRVLSCRPDLLRTVRIKELPE
ncbi:radical SAM/SPASM domain-containing protein [uncultured Paludibaculum sp.]|uniref:radical SAM/SPASM domain-containing protein n=1 Tax=uncultured Paludibaculum sp. TaxID=1765020 RepID=UPI002AAAFF79|nr:radical SAM protein [uncultured Paludibaculum sp.]